MATMFEKGQTKRYSRVAEFSGGGKTKKSDDKDKPAEDKPNTKGGLFGGYRTRQEQLDAMGFSGGGLSLRTVGRKKSDEQLALEADNRSQLAKDVRERLMDIPGSVMDASSRVANAIKDKLNTPESKMRRGDMAESKKMMAKEVAFMKKNKAPKSMIAHEKSEMGKSRKSKGVKKYARGGGCEIKGRTRGRFV